MKRLFVILCTALLLTACVSPTITGPSNLDVPPRYGMTKAEVRAHWGHPYRTSWYDAGGVAYDTWTYRRSYFVSGPYGSHIEADYATVEFRDDHVVGVSR